MPRIPSAGETKFWDSYTAPLLSALKKDHLSWDSLKEIVREIGYKPYELFLQNALAYMSRKNIIVFNQETKLWVARGFTSVARAKSRNVETHPQSKDFRLLQREGLQVERPPSLLKE